MSIARRLILSALAEADLDEIWLFSAERWGVEQADRYAAQLTLAFRELAAGRRLSRPADFIKPALHKARCQRHFIYFYRKEDEILISRVLHDSMDATLHVI
ncbi:type II toxin-antitoxin system RelE/ParE family toxin [Enterovirga sp. GCM10030262]|uniref:type II toxin-antitoxin system RelE/ParE family toxin n=1 Tax=Enterovirga sp. GCM10030262 TaxID=3273391 RepID=UPI0036183ED5